MKFPQKIRTFRKNSMKFPEKLEIYEKNWKFKAIGILHNKIWTRKNMKFTNVKNKNKQKTKKYENFQKNFWTKATEIFFRKNNNKNNENLRKFLIFEKILENG